MTRVLVFVSSMSLLRFGCTSVRRFSLSSTFVLLGLLFLIPAFAPHPANAVLSSFGCSTSPGFEVEASPADFTLAASATASSTIKVTPKFGFTGDVNLIAVHVPAEIASPRFSTSPLHISSGPQSSTLTFTVSSTALAGSYYFSVNATSGTLFQLTSVYVRVPAPSIGISSDKFIITLHQGDTSTITLTLQSLYGFNGMVDLTASVSGLLFTPYSPPTATLSINSATLTSGAAPITATLTIITSTATTPGIYSVDATAKSTISTETNSTGAFLDILGPNFDLNAKPSLLNVALGSSRSVTLQINGTQGFAGQVALTASIQSFLGTPPTATMTPSVTLTTTLNATTSVTFDAGGLTTTGYYFANITGTSGHLSHYALIGVSVVQELKGFSFTPSPATLSVDQSGGQQSSTITLQSNNLADKIDMSLSCYPEGINATLSRDKVLLKLGQTNTTTLTVFASQYTTPGSYLVSITGHGETSFSPNATLVTVDVTGPDFSLVANPASLSILQGGTQTSTISMTALNGFTGSASLSVNAGAGLTVTPSSNTVTASTPVTLNVLAASNAPPGPTGILVTATSGSLSHDVIVYVTITAPVPDFTLSGTTPVSFVSGSTGTSTITIAAVNAFTGTVALTATVSPTTGLNCNPNPTSVTLGASGTSTLTCSGSAGVYTVTVTGTSGSIVHHTDIQVTVTPPPDFSISATGPVTLVAGLTGSSTVTLTPHNGFYTQVDFSATVSPSTGLTVAFNPVSSPYGSSPSTATLSSSTPGTYSVTITGTSGSLTHSTILQVTVTTAGTPDFDITPGQTSLSINPGDSSTTTVNVTPRNTFSGNVGLTVTVSPSGPTASLSPTSVSGGSGSSTLTIHVGSNVAAGTYIVTVHGTSGSLTHLTAVQVTVTSSGTPDFQMSASDNALTINQGDKGTTTIMVSSTNGFTGTVTLSPSVSPSGPTVSLS